MTLAIISDIHSNVEALEAALDAIDTRGVDAIYCLGDIVGYGPDPGACVDLVRERCAGVVRGNHDAAAARDEEIPGLSDNGRAAVLHNRSQLSDEQLDYLAGLPLRLKTNACTFVHATPDTPARWKRLESFRLAQAQFDHFTTDVCFVGHTHIPGIMADRLGVLNVRPGHRYVINVGSVGQPRDHNARASLAFFTPEAFDYELVRVPYDVECTAEKIRTAGLPKRLAERLEEGE